MERNFPRSIDYGGHYTLTLVNSYVAQDSIVAEFARIQDLQRCSRNGLESWAHIHTYLPLFRPINVGFDTMYDNLKPTLALNGSHTKGGSHTRRDLYSPNGTFTPIFSINLRGRTQQKVDVSR